MKTIPFLTFVVGAAFTLSACDNAKEREQKAWADSLKPEWRILPDGSSFAQVTEVGKGREGNRSAYRCWPKKQGFDCITYYYIAGAMNRHAVAKESVGELETNMIRPFIADSEGYSCYTLLGYNEVINRRDENLVANRPDYSTPVWSKAWVNKYIADNGVEGTKWFDCLHILEAVNKGSVETLSTTSVTRAMAGI